MINAAEISEIIKRQLAGFESEVDLQEVGRVIEVGDGIARIYGLDKAMSGELLSFPGDVVGMVLNLEQEQVGAVILGDFTGIKEGDVVRRTSRIAQVPVREAVVGYTQACGSLGGIMVTGAYYLVVTYGARLPAIHGAHEAWRYTLMSGVIPAIPLILIRPFLPDSPTWRLRRYGSRSTATRSLPPDWKTSCAPRKRLDGRRIGRMWKSYERC